MTTKEELIKKLKALADRGVGGEKVNAQKILTSLMKKYNLKESDISDNIIKEFDFKIPKFYKAKFLINQVLHSVIGDIDNSKGMYIYSKTKSKVCLHCTSAEFLEFEAKFKFYSYHFKKEIEIFYSAFIQKNQIFPTADKLKPRQEKLFLSDKDIEVISMAEGLTKHDYNMQLENKSHKEKIYEN